jgi:sterol desaturase/sphingolipid hydroxylase (fatty acid hydroxylase superfamily)
LPIIRDIHYDHHKFANNYDITWHWSNLFLYNDTWLSTIDLWITEVIPTIILSYFAGLWLFVLYYIWAAFIQERIEHNDNFNYYPLTSGKWHMIHHKNGRYNYGVFIPIWDIIFKTAKNV